MTVVKTVQAIPNDFLLPSSAPCRLVPDTYAYTHDGQRHFEFAAQVGHKDASDRIPDIAACP